VASAGLLFPLFVQVLLTLVLAFWMGGLRLRAARGGKVRLSEVALGQPGWPEQATKVANAYANQLQLPVLFYLVVVLALVGGGADAVLMVLAWLFVATRLVHAWIHTGSNDVPLRFYAFASGVILLSAMWVWFALRLAIGAV